MNPANLNQTHFISKSFGYSEDKTPLPLTTLRNLCKTNYESLESEPENTGLVHISSISNSLTDIYRIVCLIIDLDPPKLPMDDVSKRINVTGPAIPWNVVEAG
jgi:hypothetical protein